MAEDGQGAQGGQGAGDGDSGGQQQQGGGEPKVFTQDEVNRMVGAARKEARTAFLGKFGFENEDAVKTALEEAERVRQANMTEAEQLAARVQQLEAEKAAADAAVTAAQLANLRASIARSKGLPEGLVPRVQGDDEEAITADVEELLQFAKQEQQNLGGGTNPPGAGSAMTPDEQMAAALLAALPRARTFGGG